MISMVACARHSTNEKIKLKKDRRNEFISKNTCYGNGINSGMPRSVIGKMKSSIIDKVLFD